MLRHDLAVATRRIAAERLYSALGVVVLTLGIACFLAAYVFVSYIHSYDHNFAKVDRTYVVAQSLRPRTGDAGPFFSNSAYPLADYLRAEFTDFDAVARYAVRMLPIGVGPDRSDRRIGYAEAAFKDIFDFTQIAGDIHALSEPRSALITESTARNMFGTIDVVGKTVTLYAAQNVDITVRAVIADISRSSHLSYDSLYSIGFQLLVSWDVFEQVEKNTFYSSWGNTPVFTYVLLPADGKVPVAELDRRLASVAERNVPPGQAFSFALRSRAVDEISTSNMQAAFQGSNGTPWQIDIFEALLIFAGTILAIACMNFVNLATAQSSGRTLEIGMRKAFGATARQIVKQDLFQTAMLVSAAIALALLALVPISHVLSGPYRIALAVPWLAPRLWLALAALCVAVTLAAGLYPALVLARVRPAAALRGGATRMGSKWLRSALVGAQFATASLLGVLLIVVHSQDSRVREAVLGRFSDQYVGVVLNQQSVLKPDALAAEIARSPAVRGVTLSTRMPFAAGDALPQNYARTPDKHAPQTSLVEYYVGYDFFEVLEVPLLAGRTFSRDRADDVWPTSREDFAARQNKRLTFVLDRAAARALGWQDPAAAVGQIIHLNGNPLQQYEIVGVVETVPLFLRAQTTAGIAFALAPPSTASVMLMRFAQRDTAAALAYLDASAAKLAPDRPPPRRMYFDEVFENAFGAFRLAGRVLTGLALLAFAISIIGLFGMASYVTSKRTREIGVRKTQGATSTQIIALLLWGFSKPVLIANVIAWPLAWLAAIRYLNFFSERITLTPLPFLASLAATLVLAWVTVGLQAARSACIPPTAALRQE
jgi:putative ABC transport system permease protein